MENIVILILLIIFGVLLVAGVIAFVVHKKRKSNKTSHKDSDEIKNQLLKLQEENEKLKEKLGLEKNSLSVLKQLVDNVPDFKNVPYNKHSEILMEYVKNYILKLPHVDDTAFDEFFRHQKARDEALFYILELQKMMNDLQIKLQRQNINISSETAKTNLDDILNVMMICFDVMTTFYARNKRPEQEINKKILTDKNYSRNDALAEAKLMTNNVTETPNWIIVLKETLNKNGITDSRTIFSGYKLNDK